jgi:hypothetical protein
MFEQMSITDWIATVSSLLLLISEALPFSQKVKANGILQGVVNVLRAFSSMFKKDAPK